MDKKRFLDPHSWTQEETFKKLETSLDGLTDKEALERQTVFGKNLIKEEKVSKWKLFFRQFQNPLVYILFFASLMSLFIQEFTDFFVIIGILLINGFIGFWQEWKAEVTLKELKKLTAVQNKVLRDGLIKTVPSEELVPGDLVILHEGEMITADMRLIEGDHIRINEASITGESMPVDKQGKGPVEKNCLIHDQLNMALAGTAVIGGSAKAIVIHTGASTYLASIASKTKEASPDSPLTKSLKNFVKRYVMILVFFLFILTGIGSYQGRSLLELSYILLATLVSAVPEGLPLVITFSMVVGASLLSRYKTLIRHLPAVETLGSASVIASDKTGTITTGNLKVEEVFSQDEEKLKMIAALCNDSHGNTGDPIDIALTKWVENKEKWDKEFPRIWTHSFDANLRLMATAHKKDGEEILLIKGAFETLKNLSKSPLKEEWEGALKGFLDKGLRVLAFGQGAAKSKNPKDWEITITGLIGFIDPPKKEVKEAISSAKKAGIHVIMITGDHPKTAEAVAQEVGILEKGQPHQTITGENLEKLSDEALKTTLHSTSVFARILPDHKYHIVKKLQEQGDVVAVTGDGVNDAPALRAADLGIAMGSGTEVAKSVSKMVITDNNLGVIITAVEKGRVIADNIRKVIYYLISTSIQEIFLIAFSIFLGLRVPLNAIQILWINLVTDGVQDKVFPFTKEEGNVMERKPRKLKNKFLDKKQLLRILTFSFVLGSICFSLYYLLLDTRDFTNISTIIFTSVVTAQWANGIQAQKEEEPFFQNLFKSLTINPYIFPSVLLGLLLQAIPLYLAPGLFEVEPLKMADWKYPTAIFFIAFFVVELRKVFEKLIKCAYR